MRIEEIILNEERNVKLSAWIQEVGGEFSPIEKRPAILVLPGGGYAMCSDREADPVAAAFSKAGYQAFILRYSTGIYKQWPNPLNDYEQAMKMIRDNSDAWHVDENRVAVIGFSAGGHLAACAATVAENRPNAAILGYAALKKEICDACQPGMPYPVDCVDDKTPACFLFATRDDNVVDINNTIEFQQALVKKGITFESHIYSFGMHGFSTGDGYVAQTEISKRVKNWVDDSIEWLGEIWGDFTSKGFGEAKCNRIVNADEAPNLSIGCTIGHLKKQAEEVQHILGEAFTIIDAYIEKTYERQEVAKAAIYDMKLNDALSILQFPAEAMLQLDNALREITNTRR